MSRILRFLRSVWFGRQFIVRSPIVWHNVRASWTQSDPAWREKMGPWDLTDEEFDKFMEAIK